MPAYFCSPNRNRIPVEWMTECPKCGATYRAFEEVHKCFREPGVSEARVREIVLEMMKYVLEKKKEGDS